MSDDLFLEELEILQEIRSHAQAQSKLIATMTTSLKNIEKRLAVRSQHNAPLSPNYRRRYSEYQGFNWASIGAHVVASDKHGPADVEFAGHRFNRSMGEKFNEPFLIFSRPAPEWTQTNKVYYTLIRFADYDKTPLDPSPAADISRDPARPPAETTKPNRGRQSQAKPPAGYYSATPDEIAAADRMQAEREAQGLPITATVTDPAELAKPGNRSAQLPDQKKSEGQTRPAHWASQPEAQPTQPEREPATNNPQSAPPNPQSTASPADYRKQEARRRRSGQIKQPNQPKQSQAHPPQPEQQQPPTTNPQSATPNPQSAGPQSAIPNPQSVDPLLAAAHQVTDAASFYALVNRLIPQDKTIIETMKPIIENAATTWTEKAVLLIGG